MAVPCPLWDFWRSWVMASVWTRGHKKFQLRGARQTLKPTEAKSFLSSSSPLHSCSSAPWPVVANSYNNCTSEAGSAKVKHCELSWTPTACRSGFLNTYIIISPLLGPLNCSIRSPQLRPTGFSLGCNIELHMCITLILCLQFIVFSLSLFLPVIVWHCWHLFLLFTACVCIHIS